MMKPLMDTTNTAGDPPPSPVTKEDQDQSFLDGPTRDKAGRRADMPIDVEEWDHLLVATPSEPLFSKTPSPKKEAEKPKTWKMSMIEAMIAEDKADAAAEAAASQLMLRMAVDHEPEEQQEELELDDDEKAWIKDSEVSERVWLSEQKMIGKSLKLHGRAGMKTAARWVNKRAKFNVGDLDEAAHKSDDESAGLA